MRRKLLAAAAAVGMGTLAMVSPVGAEVPATAVLHMGSGTITYQTAVTCPDPGTTVELELFIEQQYNEDTELYDAVAHGVFPVDCSGVAPGDETVVTVGVPTSLGRFRSGPAEVEEYVLWDGFEAGTDFGTVTLRPGPPPKGATGANR